MFKRRRKKGIIMATTGIWKIEKRLDHVVDYVMNIEKTTPENYHKLHKFP